MTNNKQTQKQPERFLTKQEAADYIGISPQAVWQAIQEGRMQAQMAIFGRMRLWQIPLSEVEAYKDGVIKRELERKAHD